MRSGLGNRLSSAGLAVGAVVAMLAGSSGVAAAKENLGGCIYYAPGEAGGPTKCPNWTAERMNLSGRNFTGADLRNAKFRWSNLSGTNFTNANLSGAKIMAPDVSPQTKMDHAIVDGDTLFHGMVKNQQLTTSIRENNNRYFLLGGVNPGLPSRFQPKAIVQGVTIDECTSGDSVTVPTSVNGQDVTVRALPPGSYTLVCTFFTADHQNDRGYTLVLANVNNG